MALCPVLEALAIFWPSVTDYPWEPFLGVLRTVILVVILVRHPHSMLQEQNHHTPPPGPVLSTLGLLTTQVIEGLASNGTPQGDRGAGLQYREELLMGDKERLRAIRVLKNPRWKEFRFFLLRHSHTSC